MKQPKIVVRKNERSWAIEMISQVNLLADKYDLAIKRAGGESTISYGNGKSMFPDVILYGNKELTDILQGWELKMPDVPITDEVFVHDAQRKARALKLNSCLIWNFTYAKFYVLNNETDSFEVVRQWENLHIVTRDDVATYHNDWGKTLEEMFLCINEYFVSNKIQKTSIGEVIAQGALNMLINEYKESVADNYKKAGVSNTFVEAEIDSWWNEIKTEYQFDENDKYKAYAKNVLLNWAYRIIFAHLIKSRQQAASLVNDIDFETLPADANLIFRQITERCDFYNVFEGLAWNELLPENAWKALVELSMFLKENGIKYVDQSILQNILEGSVNTTRRELNGQFTTPKTLARILACITIHNWRDDVADTCCGTGTIPHEIIEIKKYKIGTSQAVETTWASDKFKMPLQIANISMASYDTINMANRLFQMNALELKPGTKIQIVNPQDGKMMIVTVPHFGAICSNLPFVAFENLPDDDKVYAEQIRELTGLDGKSDLSYYITLHLADLLTNDGYLGIITSNSWLGTTAGNNYYQAMLEKFDLKQVHISGNGRWFKNADVVTTILLLQKKAQVTNNGETSFFVWRRSLDAIGLDKDIERQIVNSSLLDKVNDNSIITRASYTKNEIEQLHSFNLSYNALFHNVNWLLDIQDNLVPLNNLFTVIRGSRRGWDPLFFPKEENSIESKFILTALFNAKNVTNLLTEPDRDAFSCGEPMDVLKRSYPGAYEWIRKFETQKNGKGMPLPKVLARAKEKWYEMKPNEVVEIFTMMNPDKRIFFGRFTKPSFINQRLIGLKLINPYDDVVLYHALLNSLLMKFFIEAVGFGRGLGVLDINKDSISKCYMLNPELLSDNDKVNIKKAFTKVTMLDIMSVEEELQNDKWIAFNREVLRAFGIENYYSQICDSLISLRKVRSTAVEKIATITPAIHTGFKYNDSEDEFMSMAAESISPDNN